MMTSQNIDLDDNKLINAKHTRCADKKNVSQRDFQSEYKNKTKLSWRQIAIRQHTTWAKSANLNTTARPFLVLFVLHFDKHSTAEYCSLYFKGFYPEHKQQEYAPAGRENDNINTSDNIYESWRSKRPLRALRNCQHSAVKHLINTVRIRYHINAKTTGMHNLV